MARWNPGPGPRPRASVGVGTVIVVFALVLAGVGAMIAVSISPPTGASDADPTPTPAPEPGGTANESEPGPDHVRPFSITIDGVDPCGQTCRDVTVTLTNNGGNPRENISVQTDILAGGDVVWTGEAAVGTLASHASTTRTERVEVGLVDGAKIEGNDGEVTVETVVRWDDGSARYRKRLQVG